MVRRVARYGPNAGKPFYGCSRYPVCKATREIDEISEEQQSPRIAAGAPSFLESATPNTFNPPADWLDVRGSENRRYIHLPISARLECITPPDDETRGAVTATVLIEQNPGATTRAVSDRENQVLGVLQKILTRGSIPTVSPWLESAILRAHPAGQEYQQVTNEFFHRYRCHTDEPTALHPRAFLAPLLAPWPTEVVDHAFHSEEEHLFYKELFPELAGPEFLRFLHIQPPLAALLGGESTAERADFLLAAVWRPYVVIELDGSQHESQQERDLARDEKLRKCGYDVIRIPAPEVRARQGSALDRLANVIRDLKHKWLRELQKGSESEESWLAWAPIQACRIQWTIVYAIKQGYLEPRAPEWRIGVREHDYAVGRLAVQDLITWLGLLEDLYDVKILPDRLWLAEAGQPSPSAPYHGPVQSRVEMHVSDLNYDLSPQLTICTSVGDRPESVLHALPRQWTIGPVLGVFPSVLPVVLRHHPEGGSRAVLSRTSRGDTSLPHLLEATYRMRRFWEGQIDALWRILGGRDVLVLLPTGGGKSLIYQLGALLLPGRAIVVDPILALIDDQLYNLRHMGVDRATAITSRETQDGTLERRLGAFANGEYIFCFVAPERFQTEAFRTAVQELRQHTPINLIVIDEAHCVSEWGHDFRTAYLNLARIAREYCADEEGVCPPLVALTGTASRAVMKDVRRELGIHGLEAVITPRSFDRPELRFDVVKTRDSEKTATLIGQLRRLPQLLCQPSQGFFAPRGPATNCGIVFCPHVRGEMGVAQQAARIKTELGIPVGVFSGKSPYGDPVSWEVEKRQAAVDFKENRLSLLVATKAFGMGIDKPNIRYTIHFGIPGSLEAFYQEAGRAGRDRKRAVCLVLFSEGDPVRTRRLLDLTITAEEVAELYDTWRKDDAEDGDAFRMVFFHKNAFRGVEVELKWVLAVLDLVAELNRPKRCDIPFHPVNLPLKNSEEGRYVIEKALHRLVLLGVVSDYTVDYGGQRFTVHSEGISAPRTIRAVEDYVREYNVARALRLREEMERLRGMPPRSFIERAAGLLLEFIYDVIEKGRRRALREIWVWAREGRSDQQLRQRLLDYLQETEESRRISDLLSREQIELGAWRQIIDQTISVREAQELRGQVIRYLESTPDHPGLLYLRGAAEALIGDGDRGEVAANLQAALKSVAGGYRPAIPDMAGAVWEIMDTVEVRCPSAVEWVLEGVLKAGLEGDAARVFLQRSRNPVTLAVAACWVLAEHADVIEKVAARHRVARKEIVQ